MSNNNEMVSCKEYVTIMKEKLKNEIENMGEVWLVILRVGNDPASASYVKGKEKDCKELGIKCSARILDADTTEEELLGAVKYYSDLKEVDGIIVQLPLPSHINPDVIANAIPAEKDVDGFRRDSKFDCCTPKGIIDWLEYNDYNFVGKNAVVIGRSKIVGKPLVNMLIDKGATVTCCNSHTEYIEEHTMKANLVVSAIGNPKYWNCMDFSDDTEVIVDVGINRDENGKLCGDVDYANVTKHLPETYVTPVPGGVGLLTRLSLMKNVVEAHKQKEKKDKSLYDAIIEFWNNNKDRYSEIYVMIDYYDYEIIGEKEDGKFYSTKLENEYDDIESLLKDFVIAIDSDEVAGFNYGTERKK